MIANDTYHWAYVEAVYMDRYETLGLPINKKTDLTYIRA